MTARTWLGSQTNKASDPASWSNGPSVAGDDISVTGTGPFTMNIAGNDLAGDAMAVHAPLTANLARHAALTANVFGPSTAAFNLAGGDTAYVSAGLGGNAVVNVAGCDTGSFEANRAAMTVNLASGSVFSGTATGDYAGRITMQGAGKFNNTSDSVVNGPGGHDTIGVDVIGKGLFSVNGGGISFLKYVGPDQSVVMEYGSIDIAEPSHFHGQVTFTGGFASINLTGLATADSYSFKNDMLDIWGGNKVIEALRLTNQDANGFAVEPPASGSLTIATLFPGFNPDSLPVHQ